MLTEVIVGCSILDVVAVSVGFWVHCETDTEKQFVLLDQIGQIQNRFQSCSGCIWDIEGNELYFWDGRGLHIPNLDIHIEQPNWLASVTQNTISGDIVAGNANRSTNTWWYHNNDVFWGTVNLDHRELEKQYATEILSTKTIETHHGKFFVQDTLPKIQQISNSLFLVFEDYIIHIEHENSNQEFRERKIAHPILSKEGWDIGERRFDDIDGDGFPEWIWLEWPKKENWFGNVATLYIAKGSDWNILETIDCNRSIVRIDTQDIDGDGKKEILGLYTDFGLAALSKALLLQSVNLYLTEISKTGCRDLFDFSVGISAVSDVDTYWNGGELWISRDQFIEKIVFSSGNVIRSEEREGKNRHQLSGYQNTKILWKEEESRLWLVQEP